MTIYSSHILITLFFSASAIAGFAVIWRNWLEHHLHIKELIKNKLGYFNKLLLCGSCFTYWLAFIFIVLLNPFHSLLITANSFVHFFISWMALSWVSVFLRFLYVALQGVVHYQVHIQNHTHTH